MKLVKENNSVFLVGEKVGVFARDGFSEYGFKLAPTSVAYLDLNSFKYQEGSNKNTRLHSKKIQLLLECLHNLDFSTIKNKYDSNRIGIYINAASHYHLVDIFLESKGSIFETLRSSLNPIDVVKKTLGSLPGHIAIFHELHGPTFAISSINFEQVFDKASLDLNEHRIDLAILGVVNTYEDFIVVTKHEQLAGNRLLVEGAGVILLTRETKNNFIFQASSTKYLGYLENLIPNKEAW